LSAIGVALLAGSRLVGEPAAQAAEGGARQPLMLTAGELKWADASAMLPPGAEVAIIEGDPKKAAPFTMRIKFPAGFRLAPHRHPADEHVTVISGTLHLGLGDAFDAQKTKALPAGSFVLMPAGTPHFAWFSEPTVLQAHGMGPWGVSYVNPEDAPKGG
jgi:quercetin dioxygenase-like cupin family protein